MISAMALAVSTAAAVTTLTASPNPCILKAGARACRTRVVWKAETAAPAAQLVLSANRGPSKIVACALEGAYEAGWISAGNSYAFTVHAASGCDEASRGEPLASVTVKGEANSPPKPKPEPKPKPKKR
ncbi:MAG: hypothetical protein HY925_00425 [Elusimicrobia bacterium]|nr:hypothetical protein [Elusimicrobiota bacterium]